MSAIQSIVRRGKILFYRRRLPTELTRQLGRTHIWKTLGTSDPVCAVLRSTIYDKVVTYITMLSINFVFDADKLNSILNDGLNNALATPIGRETQASSFGLSFVPSGMDMDSEVLPSTGNRTDQGEGGETNGNTSELPQSKCGTRLTPEQEYLFLKGIVGVLGRSFERKGTPANEGPISPLGGLSLQEGPSIRDLLGSYVSEMSTEAWTPRTRKQTERTLSLFADFTDNALISSVTRPMVSRFVDEVLRKLPKTYGKSPKDYGKRWTDLVATNPTDGLSNKTINRHISALSTFFRWAEGRGYILENSNPVKGLRVGGNKKRPREERQAWTPGELRTYFNSPQYTGHQPVQRAKAGPMVTKDARYWVPYICLFAGLRLEEAAQLRVEDIEEIDNTWVFSIRTGEGRKLKSKAAIRKVPLHPRLIELGLLTHRKAQVDAGHSRIFPELSAGGPDARYGYKLSPKLTTYRKQVGICRPGVDLHSLRANFATALHDAGVPESIANELLGHENATMSYSRYSKGCSVETLAEAVGKIHFGV